MLNRAKEIYNYLMDEESRDVFINKMMYTVSGDYSFINTIVDKYASKNDRVCNPEFEKKLNNSISDKNIPVIIYGAGIVGKLIYTMVPKERMLCFCDMNKDLEGREIDGIKIVSPEEIYKEKKDAYIILAIWQQYMPEVKMNFKNAGYDIDSLIEGTEFFLMKGIANDMYFDEDIVKLSKDEVFIDCGSYDLSTSEDLISRRNDIKKIMIIFGAIIILVGVFTWIIISTFFEKEVYNQVVTPDNVDKMIESIDQKEVAAPGSFEVLMNTTWSFKSSEESSFDAQIANSTYNKDTMYFTIKIDGSEKDIYTSPYVPVGSALENIKLDKKLNKGNYDCVLTYHIVDKEFSEKSTVSVSMKIIIQN